MKKFIKRVFIFCIPIVLLAYFIDVFISSNLKKSNKYAENELSTWNDLFDEKINADLVIYGSSRAERHIDPAIIMNRTGISSYNLGIDGSNIFLQYLRHEILLSKNKKPRYVIYSLDMFTVQKQMGIFNSVQFLPYMLWNKEIPKITSKFEGYNFYDYNLPLIRYYGQYEAFEKAIKYSTGKLINPVTRVRGYQGKDEGWNGDFDRAKAKMKKYNIGMDPEAMKLFEQLLTECKKRQIKLVFVYTPEYIEGQKFVQDRQSVINFFVKKSQQYKIPFFNYSNDSLCYKKEYFYNANHLNKKGAELFTRKLVDTLRKSNFLVPLKP